MGFNVKKILIRRHLCIRMFNIILLLFDGEDGDHFVEEFFALLLHTLLPHVEDEVAGERDMSHRVTTYRITPTKKREKKSKEKSTRI